MIFRNIPIYIKHFFPDYGKGASVLPHSTTIKKEKPFSPSLLQKREEEDLESIIYQDPRFDSFLLSSVFRLSEN
jgi:hypothetical protein